MSKRDQGFLVGLRAEHARLENALDNVQQQTGRFPRNPKQERHMQRMLDHLSRIERTIKEEETK